MVTSARSTAVLPEVPTLEEAGGPAQGATRLVVRPAQCPRARSPDVVARLQQETVKALASPATKEKLSPRAYIPGGNTPQEFARNDRRRTGQWAGVVKAFGAKQLTEKLRTNSATPAHPGPKKRPLALQMLAVACATAALCALIALAACLGRARIHSQLLSPLTPHAHPTKTVPRMNPAGSCLPCARACSSPTTLFYRHQRPGRLPGTRAGGLDGDAAGDGLRRRRRVVHWLVARTQMRWGRQVSFQLGLLVQAGFGRCCAPMRPGAATWLPFGGHRGGGLG